MSFKSRAVADSRSNGRAYTMANVLLALGETGTVETIVGLLGSAHS